MIINRKAKRADFYNSCVFYLHKNRNKCEISFFRNQIYLRYLMENFCKSLINFGQRKIKESYHVQDKALCD